MLKLHTRSWLIGQPHTVLFIITRSSTTRTLFVLCENTHCVNLVKAWTTETPHLDLPHASSSTASGPLRFVCWAITTSSSVHAVNAFKSTSCLDVIFASQLECELSLVAGWVCKMVRRVRKFVLSPWALLDLIFSVLEELSDYLEWEAGDMAVSVLCACRLNFK